MQPLVNKAHSKYVRCHAESPKYQPPHLTRRSSLFFLGLSGFPYSSREVLASEDTEEIYAQYSYQSPVDVLRYIKDKAPEGDCEAVLNAIDTFSTAFPMYKTGPIKGRILEAVTEQAAPEVAVELGSFIGYGAVRIARNLAPGSRLVCVEANPECVAAMEGVLKHAGLRDRVQIITGLAKDVIPNLKNHYGPAQLVFEDHCKACYLPDLLLAETTGLLQPGAWVLAGGRRVGNPRKMLCAQQFFWMA